MQYESEVSKYLSVIEMPDVVVNYNDVLCTDDEHTKQIEVYCI